MVNTSHPRRMIREDAAWLAGLLDGEGCFDAPRSNPRVRLKMADTDVVLRAAALIGATVHIETPGQPGHKPLMVAQLTGDRAVSVMLAVLPWLGARRTAKVTEIVTKHARQRPARVRRLLKVA